MIRTLSSSKWSAAWFTAALFGGYGALALFVHTFTLQNSYYLELASLVAVAAFCVLLGSQINILDRQFSPDARRVSFPLKWYLIIVWSGFAAFAVMAWSTADHIPLISSFQCFGADQLAVQRELFLKGRTGWESGLVYVNAFFIGAVVPYTIALMFAYNARFRWLCLVFFLAYSISFLEKALFLKAMLPIAYLVFQGRLGNVIASIGVLVGMILLLMFVTTAASSLCPVGTTSSVEVQLPAEGRPDAQRTRDGGPGVKGPGGVSLGIFNPKYMAAGYQPSSTLDHLIWRVLSVPLFTAKDALEVFDVRFDSQPLMGATSTPLAKLLGQERVSYERLVFEAQWGQNHTGTGSANSVYVTEAFVNFGWIGVIGISLLVGQMFRWFALSVDTGFQALWLVFASGLYVAGFIGLMLSNGFVIIFLIALFVRWKVDEPAPKSV